MQSQQAFLVYSSRLVRELVKRVIEKGTGFKVVRELVHVQDLPSALMETNAEWVFVILSSNQEIPESLKIELFSKHPALRIVGLWVDDSHVRMDCLVHEQKDLTGLTLDQLTRLLRQELHTFEGVKNDAHGEKHK